MKKLFLALGLSLSAILASVTPAVSQQLIGSYVAFIGTDDLYNSKGARLSQPWQVLRQDRANYHRFGIAQPGDEWDPFFGSIENRAAMEQMIMNGRIGKRARRLLLKGGATVFVEIYGRGNRGTYINVTVTR